MAVINLISTLCLCSSPCPADKLGAILCFPWKDGVDHYLGPSATAILVSTKNIQSSFDLSL